MVPVAAQVWSIRCDIHVLDHDGNLVRCIIVVHPKPPLGCSTHDAEHASQMDAINLAAVAALQHFRRPDVTVLEASAGMSLLLRRANLITASLCSTCRSSVRP